MPLRYFQEEAIQATFDYFGQKTGNPVIALPTGTGKSWVIAGFIERAMKLWPNQRFMMLTHVKELIEQNAAKVQEHWPHAPIGIYSAGLRQKDTAHPIIFGGCASVVNNIQRFGHRDLLFIDEAHLVSPKTATVYQNIVYQLKEVNPQLRCVGLTATPFRLGQGRITDGGLFTDICYDRTGVEAFNRFITEGFLAPLRPRRTNVERQSENSHIGANGDFSGATLAADAAKIEITYQALVEACQYGEDRNSWLVFASTVEDANTIEQILLSFGISAAAVHSKINTKECDRRISDFKSGKLRCLINMGMLTTGFDHPPLDLIIMLRRTMSPGLWVQMLGRGTRPSPETGKTDCLVLDFAGNTRRLGPINDPVIPRKKGKGTGAAPVRVCNNCGTYNHAAARECSFCLEAFTFQQHIVAEAGTQELIKSDLPVIVFFDVHQVFYYLHNKVGKPPQIKVDYYVEGGMQKFTEYVQFEHTGLPSVKARSWWKMRFPGDYVPTTTAEALSQITHLRVPNRVKVWVNKQYPEILAYEY